MPDVLLIEGSSGIRIMGQRGSMKYCYCMHSYSSRYWSTLEYSGVLEYSLTIPYGTCRVLEYSVLGINNTWTTLAEANNRMKARIECVNFKREGDHIGQTCDMGHRVCKLQVHRGMAYIIYIYHISYILVLHDFLVV